MSPTPKQARTHRRKAAPIDRTKNINAFRVEASWDNRPDDPAVIRTPDRKRARKAFRDLVDKGAYVIFQEHEGWDRWRTVREVDGAALLAERKAMACRERTVPDTSRTLTAHEDEQDRGRDALARLMATPPIPRAAMGRLAARHTTGGRR
ncbi:hypothetical protein AB0I84_04725 [Streptomyces spectabilis]|uniref:hypothetical protein n=1 Tax=Streptomyces spectabilis TaxID=68270 RepID=UPI0033F15BEF